MIRCKLEEKRKEVYLAKKLQSFVWSNQSQSAHKWLKRDMLSEKVSAVMEMMEQMIETKMSQRNWTKDRRC